MVKEKPQGILTTKKTRRGYKMRERYEIYVRCATDLCWDVKSFDEWLNS